MQRQCPRTDLCATHGAPFSYRTVAGIVGDFTGLSKLSNW